MAKHRPNHPNVQRATIALQLGKRSRVRADLTMTPTGLLSVGALVSSILLSTAVIVRAARRRQEDVGPTLRDEDDAVRRLG